MLHLSVLEHFTIIFCDSLEELRVMSIINQDFSCY